MDHGVPALPPVVQDLNPEAEHAHQEMLVELNVQDLSQRHDRVVVQSVSETIVYYSKLKLCMRTSRHRLKVDSEIYLKAIKDKQTTVRNQSQRS